MGNLSIPRRRVKFIFDRSGPREYTAHQLLAFMAQSPDWPSSECLTDEIGLATRATPGIQMADLLARETMKQLDRRSGPVKRPVRQSMSALLASRRFRFEYYTREYCEKLLASARPGLNLWCSLPRDIRTGDQRDGYTIRSQAG